VRELLGSKFNRRSADDACDNKESSNQELVHNGDPRRKLGKAILGSHC
jgi:hypothetical protein